MAGGFDLGNYVEVDERIARFYDRYPDGRIATLGIPTVLDIGGKSFIVVQAAVYRTPDDPQPCVGTAAEPFPGQTTFTKNSETMNAETSAWGRALVAAGILAKGEKVASRNEVRNRAAEKNAPRALSQSQDNEAGTVPPLPTSPANSEAPPPASDDMDYLYQLGERVMPKQNKLQIDVLVKRHGYAHIRTRLENPRTGGENQ